MKYDSHTEGSRRLIFKLSALVIAASFQTFPVLTVWAATESPILVAADDDAVDSSTTIRPTTTTSLSSTSSTTTSTPSSSPAATSARTIITTASPKKVAPKEHAGATIIDDDTTSSDDNGQTATTATAATTGAAAAKKLKDKSEVPEVEYTETPQTVALCKQAVAYSNQKQYPQAISLLTKAITQDPRTIEARRLYAQTTILNSEPDRAISVLVALAKYTKATVYDKCMLASAYYAKRNSGLAINTFRDATELAPDNFYAEQGLLKSILLSLDYPATLTECAAAFGRFTYPSAQIAIKKIQAQAIAERDAAKANGPQPGDSRLSPPIPLPELTPYVMKQYGG
jgi:Flp pilus assembly protein TadD